MSLIRVCVCLFLSLSTVPLCLWHRSGRPGHKQKDRRVEVVRPKGKAEAYLEYFREYQRDCLYLDEETYSRHVRKVAGFLKDMVSGRDMPLNASLLLQGVKDTVKPKIGYFARQLATVKADTVQSTITAVGHFLKCLVMHEEVGARPRPPSRCGYSSRGCQK